MFLLGCPGQNPESRKTVVCVVVVVAVPYLFEHCTTGAPFICVSDSSLVTDCVHGINAIIGLNFENCVTKASVSEENQSRHIAQYTNLMLQSKVAVGHGQ